jgi:hypothetical protein
LDCRTTTISCTSPATRILCCTSGRAMWRHSMVEFRSPRRRARGVGSTGRDDGLVLDVPPQTGMDLGFIGARVGPCFNCDVDSHHGKLQMKSVLAGLLLFACLSVSRVGAQSAFLQEAQSSSPRPAKQPSTAPPRFQELDWDTYVDKVQGALDGQDDRCHLRPALGI